MKKNILNITSILLILIVSCGEDKANQVGSPKGEYVLIDTFSGKGSKSTEEFRLSGNKVKIKAKTWGSSVGSFSSFSLENESGRSVRGGSMTISTKDSTPGESSTTVRNLNIGDYYYIRAISGVDWEVKIYEYK